MPHTPPSSDVIIVGAGPVGLFAAFQCGMLKLSCRIVDTLPQIGGQCAALYPKKPIFDIPAHPEISAENLIKKLQEQIRRFEAPIHLEQTVNGITRTEDGAFIVESASGRKFRAKAVILAVGSGAFGPNKPPLAGIDEFEGRGGVHYHVRDPDLFRNQSLVIAGGGDSALDWAVDLAADAKKIYLVHRRAKFRALPGTLAKLEPFIKSGKVEKIVPYQLHALHGDEKLEHVEVASLDGDSRRLKAGHLLAFFGLSSDLNDLSEWGLNIERNLIPVNPATLETARKGVFAIGDGATYPGKLKLILQGFSEAAMAVHAAWAHARPGQALHFQHSTSRGLD